MSNDSEPNEIDVLLTKMLQGAFHHGMAQQRVDDYNLALKEATDEMNQRASETLEAVHQFRELMNLNDSEKVN